MVLSAEGVRKRFIFPSGLWDVFLNTKKMPNPIHCRALSGIFSLKDALGAELFRGVQRGFASGRLSCLIVLQELCEDGKPLWQEFRLCNHSSGLIEKENSLFDGSLGNSENLSFAHHIHDFVSLQRLPCRIKGAKFHPRFD